MSDIAASAVYEAVRERMGFPTPFEDAPGPLKETYRLMANAALSAWGPARAEAWDEGFSAGWDEAKDPGAFVNDAWDAETPNPYREDPRG